MNLALRNLRKESLQPDRERTVYLHEEDVACSICAGVHNKRLLLDVTASTGSDRQLTAILKTQVTAND